jgi:hypothetical protein
MAKRRAKFSQVHPRQRQVTAEGTRTASTCTRHPFHPPRHATKRTSNSIHQNLDDQATLARTIPTPTISTPTNSVSKKYILLYNRYPARESASGHRRAVSSQSHLLISPTEQTRSTVTAPKTLLSKREGLLSTPIHTNRHTHKDFVTPRTTNHLYLSLHLQPLKTLNLAISQTSHPSQPLNLLYHRPKNTSK